MLGTILIIDGSATGRILCRARLHEGGFTPLVAADLTVGLRLLRQEWAQVIVLGLPLPDAGIEDALRALRADPAGRRVPVIALAPADRPDLRVAALAAGCDEVLPRTADEALLAARIRSLLRFHAAERLVVDAWGLPALQAMAEAPALFQPPAEICLVADRPETAARWRRLGLVGTTHRVTLTDREGALARMAEGRLPDILVLAADLGRGDPARGGAGGGLRALAQLASPPHSGKVAICLVTPQPDHGLAATAFDLGADEVISEDVIGGELGLRIAGLLRRKQHADRMRSAMEEGLRLAMVDPLTGLHNRRYALQRLAEISSDAETQGGGFAILMIDLDRFKRVNDRYGHAAGDSVLTEVARRLAGNLRAADLIARIGGEEFLVVLPRASLGLARAIAEKLRAAVAERPVVLPSGGRIGVTVSIGIAMGRAHDLGGGSLGAMIDAADRALLAAKAAGRNLVTTTDLNAA